MYVWVVVQEYCCRCVCVALAIELVYFLFYVLHPVCFAVSCQCALNLVSVLRFLDCFVIVIVIMAHLAVLASLALSNSTHWSMGPAGRLKKRETKMRY